jgi:predicted metal-dependent HD superfamily phosphohydrolase
VRRIRDHKDDWNERVPVASLRGREEPHVLPFPRFQALWSALGARGPGRDAFVGLCASYTKPHRAYHDPSHLGACFRLLDDPAVRALAEHPAEVEAALWFHDVVYDTHRTDNEEQSAAWATERLAGAGVAAPIVRRVAEHVLATAHHEARSADAQLVVDVDLSILGADERTFLRFEAAIRREYAWVDGARYVAGRAAVLSRFLARPSVYRTALLRERFEERARANLAGALARLGGPRA